MAQAAFEPGEEIKPFEFDPGPLGRDEVEIAVEHCGICHSQVSMLESAARHQIKPVTEHFPFNRVNDAVKHLTSRQERYRIVLDR